MMSEHCLYYLPDSCWRSWPPPLSTTCSSAFCPSYLYWQVKAASSKYFRKPLSPRVDVPISVSRYPELSLQCLRKHSRTYSSSLGMIRWRSGTSQKVWFRSVPYSSSYDFLTSVVLSFLASTTAGGNFRARMRVANSASLSLSHPLRDQAMNWVSECWQATKRSLLMSIFLAMTWGIYSPLLLRPRPAASRPLP